MTVAGRPERAAMETVARITSGLDLPRLRAAMEATAATEAAEADGRAGQ